jgi:hypothetical protein
MKNRETDLTRRDISGRIMPVVVIAYLAIPSAIAQQHAASDVLEYKGTLAPARQAEVSPRIDGLLLKINFTAGQLVKQATFCSSSGRRTRNSPSHSPRLASKRRRHSCALPK